MGWAMLALVAVVAAVLLWVTGYPRKLWTVPATALMLGAAGYAWQGRPMLPGHPVANAMPAQPTDPELVTIRDAMFGKYGTIAWSYAVPADRMAEMGRPDLALKVWIGAVRKAPEETALWTGLGTALAQHDGNQVSPASRFAFDRAIALYPRHPGPPFFLGLALIREGKFAEARPWWQKAVDLTPKDASYRKAVMMRLIALDMYLAQQAGQAEAPRQ
jgi:cytochrome c-type biogenesis protein CcmH